MLYDYTDALMLPTKCLLNYLLSTVINTGQVACQRLETTKRLQQSAIYIQAGMRGMSARHELRELRIAKQSKEAKSKPAQPKAEIGTQVNYL